LVLRRNVAYRERFSDELRVVGERLRDYPTVGWMAFCVGV
jgi:hypothetical protein